MADFATPTHAACLQKALRERELAPPTFDPPLRPPNSVTGRRWVDLLQGLGDYAPLVCENGDEAHHHG